MAGLYGTARLMAPSEAHEGSDEDGEQDRGEPRVEEDVGARRLAERTAGARWPERDAVCRDESSVHAHAVSTRTCVQEHERGTEHHRADADQEGRSPRHEGVVPAAKTWATAP